MRIALTGGSGKLGRAAVRDLREHDYDVINLDRIPSPDPGAPFTRVDLTDFGQAVGVMSALDDRFDTVDAVVHLAAIPAPGQAPDAALFANNMLTSYNVLFAARPDIWRPRQP